MGKGDLWDDSALIDAFDDAITTYKAMHNRKHHADSQQTLLTEETNGHAELEVKEGSSECLPVESIPSVNLPGPESETTGFDVGDKGEGYYDQQTADYNELLNKYYELEEQKQKVAQQLQASYWGYQTSAQSTTTYQAHQDPSLDVSQHGFQPVCSVAAPSVAGCTMGGVSSAGCCCCSAYMTCCSGSHAGCYPGSQCATESGSCSIGASCMVNSTKQSTPEDDNIVKMGMLAAERAISSMQKELSASSSNGGEKTNGKDTEDVSCIGDGSQNINSDTNLAAVLGAWYAAGFQTGRYLMEQSKSNRSQ